MKNSNLETYCEFYERLGLESLGEIHSLFDSSAIFKDPFNFVQGHDAIEKIFKKLLSDYPKTSFKVKDKQQDGEVAFMTWSFMPNRDKDLTIEGASRVQFNSIGKIIEHRDYWDSASELFAKIPVLRTPFRLLLNKLQASRADQIQKQITAFKAD
tara:strand:- start:163 stop:627 length:465 start_codon:yes stop_codon:yes gene_type:complete